MLRSNMRREESANQNTQQEYEVPQPGIFPVVAKELDFAGNQCRTQVAQVARYAEALVPCNEERGDE
jgi:hypothetical protein